MGICSESDRKRNFSDKKTNNISIQNGNKIDLLSYNKGISTESSQNNQKSLNNKALIPM
jgi:hypothetical protein